MAFSVTGAGREETSEGPARWPAVSAAAAPTTGSHGPPQLPYCRRTQSQDGHPTGDSEWTRRREEGLLGGL